LSQIKGKMNKIRSNFIGVFVLGLLGSVVCCYAENQDSKHLDYILKTEYVIMDDGIKLVTDVYLPSGQGPFGCVMERSPYNKQNGKAIAEWFIERGLAVVLQDCRGKFASEGTFYPFRNERADGLVTVKWIRQQKWSNGKIGGFGGSYDGYTQWAISDVLDVITAHVTGADMYELVYPEGLFSLGSVINWGFAVDSNTTNDIKPEKMGASYTILPLSVADDLTYADSQFVDDWLSHPLNDNYWKSINQQRNVKCPVLSVGGWYDIFLMSQIDDFQTMLRDGHPDNRIVIGPWCHGPQSFKNDYGGIDKTGDREELLRYFVADRLKGQDDNLFKPPFKDKRYNLFIMERNEYYGDDQWPPKAVLFETYYIGANGQISTELFPRAGQSEYSYDPSNPYPSRGGTILAPAVGPALQNDNVSRSDQLVFETDTLKSPLTLLGPIRAELYVSSDAPSTDFIVCLQDVFANGNIINIQEGGRTVKLDKQMPKKTELSVWATGYQINAGHKLRAVITSSWFPRFNRNLNTDEAIYSATTMRTAHQKVYYGPKHPSAIILPVLKR